MNTKMGKQTRKYSSYLAMHDFHSNQFMLGNFSPHTTNKKICITINTHNLCICIHLHNKTVVSKNIKLMAVCFLSKSIVLIVIT